MKCYVITIFINTHEEKQLVEQGRTKNEKYIVKFTRPLIHIIILSSWERIKCRINTDMMWILIDRRIFCISIPLRRDLRINRTSLLSNGGIKIKTHFLSQGGMASYFCILAGKMVLLKKGRDRNYLLDY